MTNIQYLNVDLDLESENDISHIVDTFGEDVIVLHHGKLDDYHHASFETTDVMPTADEVINYFCGLVEALPDGVRAGWDSCRKRVLDIGYESGTSPSNFRSELKPTTLQRVAAIGASIIITIYPVTENPAADE